MRVALALWFLLLTQPLMAQEQCPSPTKVRILVSVDGKKVATKRPVYARADQKVTLHATIEAKSKSRPGTFSSAPGLRKAKAPEEWPEACPVLIRWSKVEALPVSYNNAYSAPPATIEAVETTWAKGWSVNADVHPTRMHDAYPDSKTGLGTMRYKLTVEVGDATFSTPGIDCRSDGALCKDIVTVAIRPDDTYLGYLHELLNTPYIYGSKRIRGGHQADQLVGSDCADFAVYGKRRQRGKKAFGYTYTGGLYKLASKRTKVALDDEGYYVNRKGKRLTFGPRGDVRPGDLLNLPDGHVGVLVKDEGNGWLDTRDLLMHTLFREPEIVPIEDSRWGNINGKEVLRLKR